MSGDRITRAAREAADDAYHAHNEKCRCQTVRCLTTWIADAVVQSLDLRDDPVCDTGRAPGMICAHGGIDCPMIHQGIAAFASVKAYGAWHGNTGGLYPRQPRRAL